MKKSVFPWNYPVLALALALALGWAAPAAAQDGSLYVTPKILASYQKVDMIGGHERSSLLGLGVSVGAVSF
jgi:hypothetical protein